jgi:hypothetical protein
MDAFCQGCQNLVHVFLFRIEVFDEGAIEGEKNELVAPNNTSNQSHVDEFVCVFLVFGAHDVEQLFHEYLGVVDEVDGHEVLCTAFDLPLSQPSCSSLLFLF